jgi:hypothetical protein
MNVKKLVGGNIGWAINLLCEAAYEFATAETGEDPSTCKLAAGTRLLAGLTRFGDSRSAR